MPLSRSVLYLEHLAVPSARDLCLSSYALRQMLSVPCHILYPLPFQLTPAQLSTTSSHIYLPEGLLWLLRPTQLTREGGRLEVGRVKPHLSCSQQGGGDSETGALVTPWQ